MNEAVLPPKNGHAKDRQPNGSLQHMAAPLKIEHSLEGMVDASLTMAEQAHNGETEVAQSKVALGHVSNAIAATKTKMSGLRMFERSKSPAIQREIAQLLGGKIAKQLALEAPKQEESSDTSVQPEDPTP